MALVIGSLLRMPETESKKTARRPHRFRRRLRTRIILSFVWLGFGLTALFAFASWNLRSRVENQLVEMTLHREVDNLAALVVAVPTQAPFFLMFDA